eukprot:gene14240-16370_t
MNPNAAAFAQILKQRENLNAVNANSGAYNNAPRAPPPQQPNYGHNPHYYPYQSPIPYGVQPPMPQIVNNGQSFMSTISYAYPSAYPAPQATYPHFGAPAPAMYGAPPPYLPQNYAVPMPQSSFYPNAVSHTQLPAYSQVQYNARQPSFAAGKSKPSTHPRAPAAPVPVVETSGQWYCEPCDKEFTQLGAFEAHKNTHEKCNHPGCAFSATRKVVQAHFHGSHGQFSGTGYKTIDVEGQKFRVLMGQSPEEIEQWRADRRKKFPTAAVEEAKKKELAELVEAGGVAPKSATKPGRVAGKKRELESGSANKPAKKQQREASESGEVVDSSEEIDDSATVNTSKEGEMDGEADAADASGPRKCYQFGRGKCKNGDSCAYSHDFEPKVCTFFIKSFCKQGFKCHHIHDNEARKEYRANNPRNNNNKQEKRDKDKLEGGEGDEAEGTANTNNKEKREKKEKKNTTPKKAPMINKNGELSIPEPLSGGARGTLWRKLLEDEIQKEENIVLQCLRFLVQNDFLDGVDDV